MVNIKDKSNCNTKQDETDSVTSNIQDYYEHGENIFTLKLPKIAQKLPSDFFFTGDDPLKRHLFPQTSLKRVFKSPLTSLKSFLNRASL